MKAALVPALLMAFFMAACQASGLVMDAKLPSPNRGFYGLDSQSGPATYAFTLPENASYLFAGILVKEGTPSMELQDGSGYSYGTGESVIAENAQSGTYTLTVTGSGKYTVFWDYVQAQPSIRVTPGGQYDEEAYSAVSIDKEIYAGKGVWGYCRTEGGADYTIPKGGTAWFLANPASNGITHNIVIYVADYQQLKTGGRHDAVLIPIDANDNLVQIPATKKAFPYQMMGDVGFYTVGNLPSAYRYLIKVTQNGEGVPLSIFYSR